MSTLLGAAPARPRSAPRPTSPPLTGASPPARSHPARPRRRRLDLRRWISPLALVILWQIASSSGLLPKERLASPLAIGASARRLIADGELGSALEVSLRRVIAGVAIGLAVGVTLAVAAGASRWGAALIDPPVHMLRTLPFLGLIPLFILWFGIGEAPKIALVALGVVFPVYLNLYAGIRSVDNRLLEAATVLRYSWWQRIAHVILPSALAQGLVGVRQALGVAWLALIVGEQVNADAGIGYLINNAREFLQTDVILVGLAVYALLGLITDAVVRLIEWRALAWRTAGSAR
jgi:sulfonate transport system permease protein